MTETRIVAILGGGDWYDASVDHLVVPAGLDIEAEHKKYNAWYREFRAGKFSKYINFTKWLEMHAGARPTTEEEVEEYFNE